MRSETMLPLNLGLIHFVGIGGIGMSGIAEVLFNLGYQISGSDTKKSPITERLSKLGIETFPCHSASNLTNAKVVVISSAINSDNEELKAARRLGIPVVKRAEMLAELMRLKSNVAIAGTHGKTTTTSMIAALFDEASLDPTVINGGIIQAYDSNARLGAGEWMIVEADESDGTFTKLPATLAVITNIDPEHMEHYGNFGNLVDAFYNFATNIPFYGALICCTDDPDVHALVGKISDRKVIKYGFNKQADFRVENLTFEGGFAKFDVIHKKNSTFLSDVRLPMTGEHNVLNSIGAIVVANHLGIDKRKVKNSLLRFKGVKRRFTLVAEIKNVKIIDDYAHHPVEIAAVLKAARQACKGRVIAVHQPHRYSRLSSLFDEFCLCFNEADAVAITDVHGANEKPLPGINKERLIEGLRSHGHRDVCAIEKEDELAKFFLSKVDPGDIFVCMGAGSISGWVNNLPKSLSQVENE
ncbi:MAG: UDP-N-acetylmuramate--L-alanine ligase [Pseudomonadota bacterium]|nr:UDP-N-acetylmuramate--L-alanine ligase [Pseudomonadota bacterium]